MALRPRSDEPRVPRVAVPRTAPSPGGVALALVRPHRHLGADGLAGGTPHLHALAAETYLAVYGAGRLLVIDHEGPAEHPLEPGSQITCGPGTISRVVDDGDLLLVLAVEHAGFAAGGATRGDVIVPGAPDDDDPLGPGTHLAAVTAMVALASSLEERVVEPYIAVHRAVPAALAASLDALAEAIDATDASARGRRCLEGLRRDDAHHLVDAVASPLRDGVPCCLPLVGVQVVPSAGAS